MRVLSLFLTALPFVAGLSSRKSIFKQKRQHEAAAAQSHLLKRDTDPSLLYPAHNFSIPVDHFFNISSYEPHINATFDNRYFFDASHYKPGGPVFILQSGEADASERLGFLQKGLIQQLAQLTNGIAVVFEHRYYGTSFPTPDLSTENLRYLTTQQALADEAYFAQNIVFPGLEQYDLTSKSTPYISYGGSYAGAFSAFLRVQYPDVFWGAISSSGVTEAIVDYSIYFLAIAKFAPPACVSAQQTLTAVVDGILNGTSNSTIAQLKTAFGLPNVTYNNDFASVLSTGIEGWQSLNWDPALNSPEFYQYCDTISNTSVVYPGTASLAPTAASLISAAGYSANSSLVNQMLNYIGFINETEVSSCVGQSQDSCFSAHNATYYEQDDLSQFDWRSWEYQVCTQWGYFQPGEVLPGGIAPLISTLVDMDYSRLTCEYAFNITTLPDVDAVNKYGGFNISYPRLAIIGGQWDPWLYATPLAVGYGAEERVSTANEPFYLIPQAVHHWDENGVFPNQTNSTFPPQTITDVQSFEHQFVQEWLQEWQEYLLTKGAGGAPTTASAITSYSASHSFSHSTTYSTSHSTSHSSSHSCSCTKSSGMKTSTATTATSVPVASATVAPTPVAPSACNKKRRRSVKA